ncbi:glucose-1-phosphate adenylyltransferase subunit GlgD [Tindallia californiensis]|uniref:Glucose-1-phosphate adenylyltransferase n=1 Tax=Tindallia californiensis TaxID=159292 RepID=A0A1H3MT82_9FIRM|nr:glucose-1-phosphate adenylyltransferase subunit GlgD [Tindallia californiensis]SDY79897.1 glucose-1-phosphate adenylyltransferase [Tindallia californiensis]
MKNVVGIINDTDIKQKLKDLTKARSTAAVPFGGRYRVIDFVLSNMANSGIKNVGIFTQSNNRSLLDHVDSGKEWNLLSKRDGLFILPPIFGYDQFTGNLGDIDHYYNHMDYLNRSRQEYVLISNSNIIYNMDYNGIEAFFHKKKADIVIVYRNQAENEKTNYRVLSLLLDNNERVHDMADARDKTLSPAVGLEIAFMKKSLFMQLIDDCIARGYRDFTKDALIKNLEKYKVFAYEHKGYAGKIDSIKTYYSHSMDLLDPKVWEDVFLRHGTISTKVKDEPPAKYQESAEVTNSLMANGCHIAGRVENSILSRGVAVHKNARVRNSIIMQKGQIHEGAVVENAILDKDVVVTAGKQIVGDPEYPVVVEKKALI